MKNLKTSITLFAKQEISKNKQKMIFGATSTSATSSGAALVGSAIPGGALVSAAIK